MNESIDILLGTNRRVRRRLLLCAFVALLASGAWTPAAAQTGGDGWDVRVSPYILGAAMDGTASMRGRQVDIDLSMTDIFSNLQFGAMGIVVARKGEWGLGTDLIWMSLGTTSAQAERLKASAGVQHVWRDSRPVHQRGSAGRGRWYRSRSAGRARTDLRPDGGQPCGGPPWLRFSAVGNRAA